MPAADRSFDLVLWGATGFTGRLVADYLARLKDGELRWALGGRSRARLEAIRASLAAIDPRLAELPIVLGDGADRRSLDAIAGSARVVCSTVGPFSVHGRELVAACVEAGTDYCDSTGEPQFVRAMIDAHHERARVTGARIVHCCGFDSIPSDLGTLVVQEHAQERHGATCDRVRHFVSLRGGAFSGGTAASMVQLMNEAARDPRVRSLLRDPYALDPGHVGRGPDGSDTQPVRFDRDLRRWTGPFVMAAINARVVRRTNALLDHAWGRDFRYREGTSFGAGPSGLFAATATSVLTAGVLAVMAVPPVRRLAARRVLPAPGEGPSPEKRARSSFTSRLVGTVRGTGALVHATVRGVGDPGYDETAKMVAESALCLGRDRASTRGEGGVTTPAACLGMTLVERLRRAGMTFEARDAL